MINSTTELTTTGTRRQRLPCEEESIADELLVVAGIHLAGRPEHRHGGGGAALQSVAAVDPARLVVPPSRADKRVVPAHRVHQPRSARRPRLPGAVVEDEVLVERADGERMRNFGGGVGRGDMAAGIVGEVAELVDVGDEQGAVAVEDIQDLEPEPGLQIPRSPELSVLLSLAHTEEERRKKKQQPQVLDHRQGLLYLLCIVGCILILIVGRELRRFYLL